jgi:hypothetical protein
MKYFTELSLSFILVVATVLPAFAGDVTKAVTLSRDTKVAGQMLKKGNYSITFADDKEGEMVFTRGNKEVLKAPYKFVHLTESSGDNKVIYKVADDGSFSVKQIEFRGMKFAIVLE